MLHHELHTCAVRDASVVLLLHGLGSCGDDWELQLPALLPRYTVLTPDLRGQGDSPMPAGWPEVEDLATDVIALLDQLHIRRVHVVGLSLGGAVALQLAVDAPARLRSLTVVNAFARLRATRGSLRRGLERTWLAATGRMDELGRRVADGLFPDSGQEAFRAAAAARLAGNRPLTYIKMLTAVSRFNLRSRLGEIRIPTLVVAGEQDTTVPLQSKLELAAGIRGARLERFAGSRHVTPLDSAERFNARLLAFLRSVDQAGAVTTAAEQEVGA